jgi:sugar lactone lactonase YvrE
VPNRPSGLGWDAAGRLLIVSQTDALLLRLEGEHQIVPVSDHSALVHRGASGPGDVLTNDMVVDASGRAYISSFSKSRAGISPIVRVDPDGSNHLLVEDLKGPNGMVITADGDKLVVAENGGNRLVEYSIASSGELTDERTFAALDAAPDGICLDAEGAIWAACPQGQKLLRILSDGRIVEVISLAPRMPLACMLGGPDGTTLYVMTVETIDQTGATATGRVEVLSVETPGAGLP